MYCASFLTVAYITAITLHSSFADMRMPPTITTDLPNLQIFRESGMVTLPCQASGIPRPEYEWKKDGVDLHYDNNIRRSPTSGNLTITGLRSEHEGYYQCFAHNAHGTSISNVSLLAMARHGFTDHRVVETRASIGKDLRIECRRISLSRPQPQFSWGVSKDESDLSPIPLKTSERVQITEQGHLYITNVVKKDDLGGKLYKCHIKTPVLDINQAGSYTRIETFINGAVDEEAPTSLYNTQGPVIALVGEELRLKCLFAGNPTPTVNWGRVDGVLPTGRHMTDQFATELIINRIRNEDEGTYKCWGTNKANGQPSKEVLIEVIVEERPKFRSNSSQPYNQNVTEGYDVTFFCQVNAQPAATIQWLINGEPIDDQDPGPRRSVGPDGTTLTIKSVYKNGPQGQSDLMVVQCNASNIHGYIFAPGYLNVLEPTKLVGAPSDVTIDENSTYARFDCSATSDSSTPVTLTWWKEDERLNPDEDQRLTPEDSGSLFIDFQNMTLDQIYAKYVGTYECQATNGYEPIVNAAAKLSIHGYDFPVSASVMAAGLGDLWWVLVIAAAVFLVSIIMLSCFVFYLWNKGRSYPMDKNERMTGSDPEKELNEISFKDYHHCPQSTPIKDANLFLLTPTYGYDDGDDDAWVEQNSEGSYLGEFKEDGSFIDRYSSPNTTRNTENNSDVPESPRYC